MKLHKKEESDRNVVAFQIVISLCFAVILIVSILGVTYNVVSRSSRSLKSEVSSLISAIDLQMELNIDNYLETIQKTGTLAFTSDPVYNDVIIHEYDPVAAPYPEYDSIQIEDAISDKLIELGLMENYCDFAIVYSNTDTVGKLSKGTIALYGDTLYENMEKIIGEDNDGWYSGSNNDFIRIYYAKRVNDNAILVTSFYITELESIFARSENLSSMTVRLADESGTVIYSSEDEDIGQPLRADISSLISNQDSAIISDNDFIVSVSSCGDNWKIICSIPTAVVTQQNKTTKYYALITALIASILAIIVTAVLTNFLTRPVKGMVENLNSKADTDQLTGLYNKMTFEHKAAANLEGKANRRYSVFIIDIDNFKNVNDTQGHAFGDTVIVGVARILRGVFEDIGGLTGRVGGDEFAVMLSLPDDIRLGTEEHKAYVRDLYDKLKKRLSDFSKSVNYNVTLSIGEASENLGFEELYKKADTALYKSKNSGKNRMTLYSEMGDDVATETVITED